MTPDTIPSPPPEAGPRTVVWNYGGGTQSVAIAVLIAQGKLPRPEVALFARLPREMPRVIAYLSEHVAPLLATVGLVIDVVLPDAKTPGLYWSPDDPLPLVPSFTAEGRRPALCSGNWKRDRILRRLQELGYGPRRPVTQWLGYSVDEKQRANGKSRRQWVQPGYPLLTLVPLRREHCRRLVELAGLPSPPRSRCGDCANQTNAEWREVRESAPELFQLAIQRDEAIRDRDPRHAIWLHRSRRPLSVANLDDDDEESAALLWAGGCNSAGCYT